MDKKSLKNMHMEYEMSLKDKVKQLPQKPGVYIMLDSLKNIIYVGKAKNIKNRVSQYFNQQKDREPKVAEMIRKIDSFEYLVMDTELDALIEECRLIKELKPRYNRQMKNYRRYCYLKIPNEPYPKILIVQDKQDDRALYFGPFTSPRRVEMAVQFLKDFYPVRKCTTPGLAKSPNGCLFHQLERCLGVCTGQVNPDDYNLYIEKICQLLNGRDLEAMHELLKKQDDAIENLDFEKAARYQDYYLGLRHVIGKQQLVMYSNRQRNILAVEKITGSYFKFFFIKGNRLLFQKIYDVNATYCQELHQDLTHWIREIFLGKKNNAFRVSQFDIDEAQIITSYLKKNKDRIISLWIPSTRLKPDQAGMDEIVNKVMGWIKKSSC